MKPYSPRLGADLALSGVYAITPSFALGTETLLHQVEAALRGGVRTIQYRDKGRDPARRLREAQALVDLCHRFEARCIINDDIALALASQADGVHLGQHDGTLQHARQQLTASQLLGASCYNQLALAHQAEAAGADYIAFGRFYPSANKPLAVAAEAAILSSARAQLSLPIVAIGGITAANGTPLIEAGADSLAVIQAVFSSPEASSETIEANARKLCQLFPRR